MSNAPESVRKIISKLGWKHGVSPNLLFSRLLSEEDVESIELGDIPAEAIDQAVGAWIFAGKPDYAHGSTERMDRIKK
jgi:hypothetical protein